MKPADTNPDDFLLVLLHDVILMENNFKRKSIKMNEEKMDEIDVWSGTRIARLSCLEISNGLRHPEDLFTQKFETRFVIFLTPKTKRETWLIILEREKLVESIGLSSAIGDTVLSTRDPLSSFIRSNLHPIQIVLFVFFCSLSLLMNSTWTSK